MSRERCIAFMQDLESCDLERLKPWFVEESVLWVPPTAPIEGQRRILAMFRIIFRMYSKLLPRSASDWMSLLPRSGSSAGDLPAIHFS